MVAILSRPQCVNIYHFYTSDVFYTDVYYFTFVVPKMYQWQVRNDFNKDVYIYVAHLGPVGPSWAPCWPYEPCYQSICVYRSIIQSRWSLQLVTKS